MTEREFRVGELVVAERSLRVDGLLVVREGQVGEVDSVERLDDGAQLVRVRWPGRGWARVSSRVLRHLGFE